MGADNTVSVMERAIEAGNSVLIENMGESIDAVLNPVITRSTFKKGRNLYVKLGDKEVRNCRLCRPSLPDCQLVGVLCYPSRAWFMKALDVFQILIYMLA